MNLCSPKPSFPHSLGLAMHPPQPAVEGFLQLDDVLLPVGDLNLLFFFQNVHHSFDGFCFEREKSEHIETHLKTSRESVSMVILIVMFMNDVGLV